MVPLTLWEQLPGVIQWVPIKDGNIAARKLADRHYSRKTIGHPLFCGPGKKLILITPDDKVLFVWRKAEFRRDGQIGVECTLFRNEGNFLSSELIKTAVELAKQFWPKEKRFFTFVWDEKIKSTNPGFCFKKAGWKYCGRSKVNHLSILEFLCEV